MCNPNKIRFFSRLARELATTASVPIICYQESFKDYSITDHNYPITSQTYCIQTVSHCWMSTIRRGTSWPPLRAPLYREPRSSHWEAWPREDLQIVFGCQSILPGTLQVSKLYSSVNYRVTNTIREWTYPFPLVAVITNCHNQVN